MSLLKAVIDAANGEFVGEKVMKARLKVCDNCNYKRGSFCGKCSCYLRFKTAMPSESCPIGKWAEVVSEVKPELPVEPIVEIATGPDAFPLMQEALTVVQPKKKKKSFIEKAKDFVKDITK